MTNEIDYTLKLLILGGTNVGKTSFFNKIQNNSAYFSESTIGVDFTKMYYHINNKQIKVNIWDTTGQDDFHTIIRSYFRDICGIVLMFDVSKPETCKKLECWLKILLHDQACCHDHPILLLGNKGDLQNNTDAVEIDKLIQQYKLSYREISCKTDTYTHLEEIFTSFLREIMESGYVDDCCGIKKMGTVRSHVTLNDIPHTVSTNSGIGCNIV
tara:strand:+ start:1269 stop:1907 length:639 start_codon:yes stop_codon:yes gene_type:complete